MFKKTLARLACLMFLLMPMSAVRPEGRPTNIAVCDLAKLYQECAMSKDRRAELEAIRTKAENQLQEYQKSIEKIERELPLYEKESAEYKERKAKIEELQTEGQAKKRVETAHLERKFSDFLKEFHAYALQGIQAVARSRDYDIVLQVADMDLAKLTKAESVLNRIFTQQVLHSEASTDITGEVMKKLDMDYDREKEKKTEQAGKTGNAEKDEKAEKTENTAKDDKAGKTEKTGE
jgi:Skp family chaperone for outer membrane proteins